MTDFVEYIPKRHGQKPPYWTPDTLTGLDNKNYVRQPNWAWIAGTTYYVPYEAVHGQPRPEPVDAALDADAGPINPQDIIEALQADKAKLREEIDRLGEALVAEREENLWSAYNTGDVRGDEWTHLYMSDGEWLVRQCGLDPKQIYYKAEQIRNAIPIAARAALQETGQ